MGVDWKTGAIKSQLKQLTTGAAIFAEGRLYCFGDLASIHRAHVNQVPDRIESGNTSQCIIPQDQRIKAIREWYTYIIIIYFT